MKKLVLPPLILGIFVVGALVWFFINVQPVAKEAELSDFTVSAGSSASEIGSKLSREGFIKNPTAFKVYVQFSGISANIQAGDYRLSPSYNLFQIVKELSGVPLAIKVTIPEGFTGAEIAEKFTKSLDRDEAFKMEFIANSKDDEGYLFPDTYLVANNSTPGAIINLMKSEFTKKTTELNPTRDQVILASIIEEETKGVEEKPTVSGILMNRLRIGMALQVDVAPNTYKTVGLPPSPIANPGLLSIKAAINPAVTDYLYYLHDPTGQIHYAKTLDGHNANIEKYLR